MLNITSTTDSAEAVTAAMGELAQTTNVAEKPSETPTEVKTAPTPEPETPETEPDETQTEASDEDNEETETEELVAKDESGSDQKPKKKGGWQRRVDKLSRQKAEIEREKEYWRNVALGSQKPEAQAVKPAEIKPEVSTKPKANDFATHDEYVEALTDWKVNQELSKREQKQKEETVKTEFQTKVQKHQSRIAEFKQTHDDFDDVIEQVGNAPMSLTVQEVILNSDNSAQLMYELAKDPKEFQRICALSPVAAAVALGKVEARLTQSTTTPQTEKKTTKAPPPVTPVKGKGVVVPKSIYDENISQAEFERQRAEQEKAWRAARF